VYVHLHVTVSYSKVVLLRYCTLRIPILVHMYDLVGKQTFIGVEHQIQHGGIKYVDRQMVK